MFSAIQEPFASKTVHHPRAFKESMETKRGPRSKSARSLLTLTLPFFLWETKQNRFHLRSFKKRGKPWVKPRFDPSTQLLDAKTMRRSTQPSQESRPVQKSHLLHGFWALSEAKELLFSFVASWLSFCNGMVFWVSTSSGLSEFCYPTQNRLSHNKYALDNDKRVHLTPLHMISVGGGGGMAVGKFQTRTCLKSSSN